MKKILIILAIIAVSGLICFYSADKLVAYARSVIFKSGVVIKNNVSIRSGSIDQRNGSMATTTQDYSKELGGVDDYNNSEDIPADTFTENWTQCTSANNYCGTDDATVCGGDVCWQDNRTNLVWSDYWNGGENKNWFWANNCAQPESAENPGTCTDNYNEACQCVKLTSSKTGCEAWGDGNWRLPHQKELMQAYIDGSWCNSPNICALPHAGYYFWSATTQSNPTHCAWFTSLTNGYTNASTKTSTNDVRCVRR